MDDNINRKAAITELDHGVWGKEYDKALAKAILESLPSAQPKKGKWINNIHDLPICNQCGYIPKFDRAIDDYYYSNFCPNCGADLRDSGSVKERG